MIALRPGYRGRRRGFVLLSVLWVIVGASVVAMSAAIAARESFEAARNRVNAERALWIADGCIARARGAIDELLGSDADPAVAAWYWRRLGDAVSASPLLAGSGCDIDLEAAGTHIDVNAADTSLLASLFRAEGRGEEADSLADAIADWRDADDIVRPLGAEAAWYAGQGRLAPRNGPFADDRELRFVRGFESDSGRGAMLSVESGRISINNAPLTVLAAVPGFRTELLQRIAEWRDAGRQVTDLMALTAGLAPSAVDDLMANYPTIVALTTTDPDAWILTARGHAGFPAITVWYELRLVRAGAHAAIMRRRMWR